VCSSSLSNGCTTIADSQFVQVDWTQGRLSGTMTASGIPHQAGPITTLWQGEIIDMVHASFESTHFNMSLADDFKCWSKFPSFASLRCYYPHTMRHIQRAAIDESGCLFMRWKEQSFLSAMPSDMSNGPGTLTIAGFYYVRLERATGSIAAWYFDPSTHPLQPLSLEPAFGARGHSFGRVAFS
jgi:hypothetical protein